MEVIGPGGATIYPCNSREVAVGTPPPPPSFPLHPPVLFFLFYLKPVCFLMYLSLQLVQIASSITSSRYENVDPPAPRAQAYCYQCNLKASCGRSSSRLLCCKEKSGDLRRRWRRDSLHLLIIGGGEERPSFSSEARRVGQVAHTYYTDLMFGR